MEMPAPIKKIIVPIGEFFTPEFFLGNDTM